MSRCVSCRVDDVTLQGCRRMYRAVFGDFLLPRSFPGHEHEWRELDAGFCVCRLCGAEHVCFRGECPLAETECSERACTISGCVVVNGEMRAEREAMDRVASFAKPKTQASGRRRRRKHDGSTTTHADGHGATQPPSAVPMRGLSLRQVGGLDLHEFVEMVVRELLDSRQTRECTIQEVARDHSRRMSSLGRLLRESVNTAIRNGDKDYLERVNLVTVEAQLSWHCRKCRVQREFGRETKERVIRICVDNICSLLTVHGWQRVSRQLQHPTRGREFVCSMLYLMRVGITYGNRCLLQRLEILHDMLPLQVFLPQLFRIRSKAITEGENVAKLDIRRLPV